MYAAAGDSVVLSSAVMIQRAGMMELLVKENGSGQAFLAFTQ